MVHSLRQVIRDPPYTLKSMYVELELKLPHTKGNTLLWVILCYMGYISQSPNRHLTAGLP